jgi:transcriptional regulator with PAS, ATPase and Fis domain
VPASLGNAGHFVSLRELEDDYIEQVLVATGNNKTQACRILGIHPTSLMRRMKKDKVADF